MASRAGHQYTTPPAPVKEKADLPKADLHGGEFVATGEKVDLQKEGSTPQPGFRLAVTRCAEIGRVSLRPIRETFFSLSEFYHR